MKTNMFATQEEKNKAFDDEMLEIFTLIEKNNHKAHTEAKIRYQKLIDLPNNFGGTDVLMMKDYDKFKNIGNGTK